jgi:hypothetical protein
MAVGGKVRLIEGQLRFDFTAGEEENSGKKSEDRRQKSEEESAAMGSF